MNANDSRHPRDVTDLARMLPVPAERDLPAGRRHILKEHLMTEFRGDQPARAPGRARPSRRAAFTAAAGLAATAMAAAGLTVGLGGLGGISGHGGPQPGSPGGQVTATQLLTKIANAASRSPAPHVRNNQFEYIASEDSFGSGGRPAPAHPHKRQIWLSVADQCRPGLVVENGQRTVLSEPKRGVLRPGKRHGKVAWVPFRIHCPQRGGLNDPTYRSLQSLPTDPRALLHLIYTTEKGAGQSPDQEAFTTIGDLLFESIPPPDVSAALYKAAALIPGVRVVPDAVDAIGRHGVAVSFTFRGVQSVWIFNKTTFQWIGEQEFSNGTLNGKSAVLTRAIVDHAGELPGH